MSYPRRSAALGRRGTGKQAHENKKRMAREDERLVQFLVCAMLFLTVFAGKGVFPERINQVEEEFLQLIGMDTDFRGAFTALGEAIGAQEGLLEEMSEFCVAVFGAEKNENTTVAALAGSGLGEEQRFFNSRPDHEEFTAHLFRMEELPNEWCVVNLEKEVPSAVPVVGTILLKADYQGKQLPKGYTMDHISLGELEVCTPVMGTLWSEYGYRDHPIDGEYKFHNGVDLGAEQGTAVSAFAAGTVDYIGENDVHGLYLQIDHGNGVKSFYAHCSKLFVRQGQQVSMGERVADVGATGAATGPHLHFELKCFDTHVDPAYYINYQLPK